jgi:hypothetical protein
MRVEIKLEDLYVYVHDLGFVKLDCTPHYKFARYLARFADGEEKPYLEYVKKYYSAEEAETSVKAFLITINFVCGSNESAKILISKSDGFDNRIIIIDGVHRAAISKAIGLLKIRCMVRV